MTTGYDILAVINDVAATNSRTEKEEILRRSESDLLKLVLSYAYDPFKTFGIIPPKCQGSGRMTLNWKSPFWTMLEQLIARKITGNDAAELVNEWLVDNFDEASSELAWRILMKDMRAGFTGNTVNKVWPGLIPSFDVMLAHKFEEKRVTYPVAIEPKLDGVRVIALVTTEGAQFLSRSGKVFTSVEHIGSYLAAGLKALIEDSDWRGGVMVDGEIVSGTFNKTVSEVRKKDVKAIDAIFNIFDLVPLADFNAGREIIVAYKLRRALVEKFVATVKEVHSNAPVAVTPRYLCSTVEEIYGYYQSFRDRGLEGAIVKPLDGTYQLKRSYGWLKMKAEESVDVPVIGVFEGTGKNEGKLGGLLVDLDGVTVRVGGGFSDAQRMEFWTAWHEDEALLKGRLIEVEYHEKTPDGSLRHPRFVKFRDDLPCPA
jgi:hypothetical protein